MIVTQDYSPEQIAEVRKYLEKIRIKAPEGMPQEAMDAFIADVLDDITDENIKEKLEEQVLDEAFKALVTNELEEEE